MQARALIVALGVAATASCVPDEQVAPTAAVDPDYDNTPILVLNPTTHSQAITRADITLDGATMVTTSRDDTIKVWDVATLQVTDTLRVPISVDFRNDPGAANLRSVAITPDGKYIAAAGYVKNDGTSRLFIFDRVSGEMLPNAPFSTHGYVGDLTFSRDGHLLAAGVFDKDNSPNNGLWVWDTSDWSKTVCRDPEYGGLIFGVAFNAADVLITTSFDQNLRRYENVRRDCLATRATVATRDGLPPYQVAFSPNGGEIAVTYRRDTGPTPVSIYKSDASLAFVRDLDVGGLDDGKGGTTSATNTFGVTFSKNGQYVYAGIAASEVGAQDEKVRRWSATDSAAAYKDFVPCTDWNTVQVLPDGDDGAIFINVDPCVTKVNGAGEMTGRTSSSHYEIYNDDLPATDTFRDFLVSKRGDQFYMKGRHQGGIRFDIRTRDFTVDPVMSVAELASLDGYVESRGGITVVNWANQATPRMVTPQQADGVALDITAGGAPTDNRAFSVDVAPSGEFAIVGSVNTIGRYGADGKPQWPVRKIPALVMRANITPDENVIVTYCVDGVIRWHDVETGYLILSLFIDVAQRRWVIWTPGGYYDASAGADDLIGWHLNHGREQAPSFLPASRYQDLFLRPEKIQEVVDAISEGRSVRSSNPVEDEVAIKSIRDQAPPIVRIRSTEEEARNGERGLKVSFEVKSPSNRPVDRLRVRVDGSAYVDEIMQVPLDTPLERWVPIKPGSQGVTVTAGIGDNWATSSYRDVPTSLMRGTGPDTTTQPLQGKLPVLHALIVGVNKYPANVGSKLNFAVNDARFFEKFLRSQIGIFSKTDDIVIRVDETATLQTLREDLARLTDTNVVKPDDVVVLFLAGHSSTNEQTMRYYYIPYGIPPTGQMTSANTLTGEEIVRILEDTPARVFLFMDTCHANAATFGKLNNRIQNAQKNMYVFASSLETQKSIEDSRWQHGAFTKAFLDGVGGLADTDPIDKFISSREIKAYLETAVSNLTSRRQEPKIEALDSRGQAAPTIERMFKIYKE